MINTIILRDVVDKVYGGMAEHIHVCVCGIIMFWPRGTLWRDNCSQFDADISGCFLRE